MTKVNNNTMREQYDGQYKTFCKKNSDYGNSFEESLDKHGIVASVVRMGDKMNRLESLTDDSRTQQVGSESLLDTLEDLSNYAAMTVCWLKGVRAEDGEEETICIMGDDRPILIRKNGKDIIPDEDNVVEFRATEYILKMLDDIYHVVQMKLEKNELLVPMDIYDEAGLIAKCIVQSGTRSESIPIIKDYLFDNSKNIPFEIREWIYGVIMRHLYYINKEHSENEKSSEPKDDDNVVDAMRYAAEDMMNDPIIRKRINEEIISYSLGAIIELMVDDIKRQRDPKVKLDERQRIVDQREKYYKKIARFIRLAPNIEFADFERYFNTRADLHSYERQLIIEGVAEELDSQIDKELEKFKEQFMESIESNANSITVKQDVEIRLFSKEINSVMDLLVQNVLDQRSPANDLNNKLRQAHDRNMAYKKIACLIIITPWLSFDGFSGYVDTFRELMPDEKQLIKEGVATEIYSQTDKNPGGEEESEFRTKKFNIPKEDEVEEPTPLNKRVLNALLWFLPLNQNYRGDKNDSDC
nr:MAG TPA: Nucleotide modification associated domain 1 [Caudoviricetes sp.]